MSAKTVLADVLGNVLADVLGNVSGDVWGNVLGVVSGDVLSLVSPIQKTTLPKMSPKISVFFCLVFLVSVLISVCGCRPNPCSQLNRAILVKTFEGSRWKFLTSRWGVSLQVFV